MFGPFGPYTLTNWALVGRPASAKSRVPSEMFARAALEKLYGDVVKLARELRYPKLMTESERKMIEIARKGRTLSERDLSTACAVGGLGYPSGSAHLELPICPSPFPLAHNVRLRTAHRSGPCRKRLGCDCC
jgi:hypothetical protein